VSQNKITILSTTGIDEAFIKEAALKNIWIDVCPFIATEPILSTEVQQEIEQALLLSAIVVFTSVNAVEAVATELNEQRPDWQIFCIGHATRQRSEKYFGKGLIAGSADSAKDLARVIIDAQLNNVIFFCGNQRRDELPRLLKENNIDVNEVVVYETVGIPREIGKKYNGILFFNPVAVKGFFQTNKLDDPTVLFAIGHTTANKIKKHSKNKIIISNVPEKKILLEKVINYFQANPIHN